MTKVQETWIGLHKTDNEWKFTDNSTVNYLPELNPQASSCVTIRYIFDNVYDCDISVPALCKKIIE